MIYRHLNIPRGVILLIPAHALQNHRRSDDVRVVFLPLRLLLRLLRLLLLRLLLCLLLLLLLLPLLHLQIGAVLGLDPLQMVTILRHPCTLLILLAHLYDERSCFLFWVGGLCHSDYTHSSKHC